MRLSEIMASSSPTLMIGDETYDEFVVREGYQDGDGNVIPLEILVYRDPAWACNRIRHMRNEIKELQDRLSKLEQ